MSYEARSWTQPNEVAFLQRLGTWTPGKAGDRHPDRKQLLRGYLEALDLRARWGLLDKQRLRFIAEKMLEE